MFKISILKMVFGLHGSLIVITSLLLLICSCNNPSGEERLVGKRWILTKVYLGKDREQKWGSLNDCNRIIINFSADSVYNVENKCSEDRDSYILGCRPPVRKVWFLSGNELKMNGFLDFQLIKLDDDELVMKSHEPGRRFIYYFTSKMVTELKSVWKQSYRISFKDNSKHVDRNCFFTLDPGRFSYYRNGKLVYRDGMNGEEDHASKSYSFESRSGDRLIFIHPDTAKLLRYNGDGDTEVFVRKKRTIKL